MTCLTLSSAADIYIWAFGGGVAFVLLILLNVFAIALCKSAARADQLAAEHFALLTEGPPPVCKCIPEDNTAARSAQRESFFET